MREALSEAQLVQALGLTKRVDKTGVVAQVAEFLQFEQVAPPVRADLLINQRRQRRTRLRVSATEGVNTTNGLA